MPSEKVLQEKKQIVEEMTERLKSKSGVFVDYKGITVIEDTQMRVKLREENVQYSVIKNSLMKFAIKNVGFEELDNVLVGTTSLATSADDPIAPARVVKEFADKLPDYFEIKAGFMDGKILSKDEVLAIASIPPLPILQAQFLGTLLAPITSLAVVLKAVAEKGGAVDVDVAAPKAETKAEEPKAEESAVEEAKAEEPATEPAAEAEAVAEPVAETAAQEEPAAQAQAEEPAAQTEETEK
ncbi:MAG: 50S ribosomal protein L10 [Oscillospiraceae bacterium]|nr:50S ribosomal protein L10 [Oscillospiraceae bacterium]